MIQVLANSVEIYAYHAQDSISDFYAFLDRPKWFKDHFIPVFEQYRTKNSGIMFLAKNPEQLTVGSLYCEPYPQHYSYGKQIPLFGWFDALNSETAQKLLQTMQEYLITLGFTKVRGPINNPKLFGGWGAMKNQFESDLLIDAAWNKAEIPLWIEQAGFHEETTYYSIKVRPHIEPHPIPENIQILDVPFSELLQNQEIMAQALHLIHNNFSEFLPDTSKTETKFSELLEIVSGLDHPEDFFILAQDIPSQQIVAALIQIPNIFEKWAGKPLRSTNYNAMVLDKNYRGNGLIHALVDNSIIRLQNRGFDQQQGALIWTKNIPSVKVTEKHADPFIYYGIYEKELK